MLRQANPIACASFLLEQPDAELAIAPQHLGFLQERHRRAHQVPQQRLRARVPCHAAAANHQAQHDSRPGPPGLGAEVLDRTAPQLFFISLINLEPDETPAGINRWHISFTDNNSIVFQC